MSTDRTASATLAPGFDPIEARIIEERARRLAAPPAAAGDDAIHVILVFRVGAELYGLDLAFVAQVVRVGSLVQIPGARPPFAGIFTLRGGIVSAFSLSQAIGQPQKPMTEQTRAIVCGTETSRFALLADEVLQVESVRAGALTPPESTAALTGCTRGLTATGIIVLDGEPLAKTGGPLFTGPEGLGSVGQD
ncbi:MAG TPA: chemotaxis protein CheW [Ferrovibrio sp.]|jgi:purine-binding chemotaxis protein CheW|uniref:chemotaxis protein CheW n=1 Tax=Ferrovibrio sp. TaxID=1917215 RepID=UPI002ED05101